MYPFLLSEALLAANQLKTMRRHLGISLEGERRCRCTRERPNSEVPRKTQFPAQTLLLVECSPRPTIFFVDIWEKAGPLSPESQPSHFYADKIIITNYFSGFCFQHSGWRTLFELRLTKKECFFRKDFQVRVFSRGLFFLLVNQVRLLWCVGVLSRGWYLPGKRSTLVYKTYR